MTSDEQLLRQHSAKPDLGNNGALQPSCSQEVPLSRYDLTHLSPVELSAVDDFLRTQAIPHDWSGRWVSIGSGNEATVEDYFARYLDTDVEADASDSPKRSAITWMKTVRPGMRRFPTGWRLVRLIAALLILMGIVGALSAFLVNTHDQLDATRSALSSTKQDLATSDAQLSQIQSTLSSTQAQLSSAQNQVQSLQGQLSNATGAVSLEAGLIEQLKTCLNGYSQTLSDDLAGAYLAGTVVLESVQGTCDSAVAEINALGG